MHVMSENSCDTLVRKS